MRIRIQKSDNQYCAEYWKWFRWWFISGSWSITAEQAEEKGRKYAAGETTVKEFHVT